MKNHEKHLEYFLSILGELFELSDYYDNEKKKFMIENQNCRLMIHNTLEKSKTVAENISQLLNVKSINLENFYDYIQKCWLDLYLQIEEYELSVKSTDYFNYCSVYDKKLFINIMKLLKEGCKKIPDVYLFQQSYSQEIFKHFLINLNNIVIEKPTCFICYPWDKDINYNLWIKKIAKDLNSAGVEIIFDVTQNSFGRISNFTKLINKSDFIIIVGCQQLLWKWQNPKGRIISKELKIIKKLVGKEDHKIIKILYSGHPNGLDCFPDFLHDYSHCATDFSIPSKYFDRMFNLLNKIFENDKKLSSYILLYKEFFLNKTTLNYLKLKKTSCLDEEVLYLKNTEDVFR